MDVTLIIRYVFEIRWANSTETRKEYFWKTQATSLLLHLARWWGLDMGCYRIRYDRKWC